MELRSYQLEIVEQILSNPKSSDLIQLATGGGKTVIAGQICNLFLNKGKRVLFLAHRAELISQPKEKFFSQFGIDSSIIMAKHESDLEMPMQIASVQTFHRRLNFDPNVIIIDEAHHSEAATYQTIIKTYPKAKLIGLTATPYRLSGKGFKDTFSNLITSMSVKELEDEGFLVPAKCYSYPIGHDKLSRIKVIGGDYNEQDLEELMLDRVLIEDIAISYKAHAKGKKMIVFASTVNHSKAICERLNESGIESLHIDAYTKNRNEIIDEFRFGQTKVLCNVGIATEGVDIPEIEVVCLARPTTSLALYLQMVGRGARPNKGKKDYLLLDHSDNFVYHGAPNREHEWVKYFKGVTKREIRNENQRRVFKAIIGGNETLIDGILNMPVNIKGFALEEVFLSKSEYYARFIESGVSKNRIAFFDAMKYEKDVFAEMIGIDKNTDDFALLPSICTWDNVKDYYGYKDKSWQITNFDEDMMWNCFSHNGQFANLKPTIYTPEGHVILSDLIAPIQILHKILEDFYIEEDEGKCLYWSDFCEIINTHIYHIPNYSLSSERKEFIKDVLHDDCFIAKVASMIPKFNSIKNIRVGVSKKINLISPLIKKVKQKRIKKAGELIKTETFQEFVSNVLDGDLSKFEQHMKTFIGINNKSPK